MKGFSMNQGIRIVNMCSWNMKTAPGGVKNATNARMRNE